MGEAKWRREHAVPTVYHHTSSLRTNLIWMSGVIQVEGQSKDAVHPQLGEIQTNASLRRGFSDFPPVAWFTRRLEVPKCLQSVSLCLMSKDTGEITEIEADEKTANGIALQRIALGFPVSAIPVVPWPEHKGYETAEGMELNSTAREVGDDPDDWYVSERPVDLLAATEVYRSSSIAEPKLRRDLSYLREVHDTVRFCRENPDFLLPPTWMPAKLNTNLSSILGVPVIWA